MRRSRLLPSYSVFPYVSCNAVVFLDRQTNACDIETGTSDDNRSPNHLLLLELSTGRPNPWRPHHTSKCNYEDDSGFNVRIITIYEEETQTALRTRTTFSMEDITRNSSNGPQ
ncbi:hypothetical protein KL919_003225 [Ogataea angusta]|nr:hypothetical protein KL909_001719 [Ogataea angusta]KAG7842460.1 hypothetical protein KL941_005124 [Ogataea angusta]KAG7858779.1 hypothetical protein KL939_002901 [Ogataea angusta]KAG7859160.1 hypothetical protein KL919_003225 [Ogataea angusta]